MDLNDLLLIISMSDSLGVLGILHNDRLFMHRDLSIQEEQDTLDKLITVFNSGYKNCIVTRDGTYINS
ncbi:hypothetical protein [Desulfosporosinus sp.]|uniref:hypothetical protein n=1 Tax=Desulfosporosinus sp. TaxID=157907 RepID=UPI00230C1B12|nr:hypothetical protein [Desulfosporosinus sp.]MDA8224204.1 hypothetical protein [Desulfitobacterium hafniense]